MEVISMQIALELISSIFAFLCVISFTFERKNELYSLTMLRRLVFGVGVLLLMDAVAYMFRGSENTIGGVVVRVSNYLVFVLTHYVFVSIFLYVRQLIMENGGSPSPWMTRAMHFFATLAVLGITISQWTHWYYSIDEQNIYHREKYYLGTYVIPCVEMIVFNSLLLKERKYLRKKEILSILTYLFFPVVAAILQSFIYGFSLLNLAFMFSIILIYMERMRARAVTLRKTLEELEDANKIKNEFLKTISHEVRTPLHAILGFNELTFEEDDISKIKENAMKVQTESKALLSMVNDMLDFITVQEGSIIVEKKEYQTRALLQDVILYAEHEARQKSLDFKIDISEDIPSGLIGDYARNSQICYNLLSNAVKFTKEGWVCFQVLWDEIDDSKGELVIKVSDSGIGMRKEYLSKITNSFQRIDLEHNQNIPGLGIGLSVNYLLVERMKGQITVESEYGKGSCFTVRIPQKYHTLDLLGEWKQQRPQEQGSEKGVDRILTEPFRLLVVDDSKMNLALVKGMLRNTKAEICTAENGLEAVEYLEKEDNFDCILMDMMMPIMDGSEALREIKRKGLCEHTKIIAFTANVVAGSKEEYLNQGFDDYMSKPVIQDDMLGMLEKWIYTS